MPVLETVRYRLKEGATQQEAIKAWQDSQAWALEQPGFLSRKLAVTEDGEMLDHVEWQDMATAKAAFANFNPELPALQGLLVVLEESSMVMNHYEVLAETD